jgi:hypothetical protein
MDRTKRPSIALINQSGFLDIAKTFADALGVGLLGSGRVTVRQILSDLDALDKNFTLDNWNALEVTLGRSAKQVGPLVVKVVDKLSQGELGNVAILNGSRVARATSVVFLDCKYGKEDCVVKLMERNIDMVELFIETIINILMNKVVIANEFINVPNVKKMGTVLKFPVQDIGYVSQSTKQKTAKQKTGGSATRLILIQEKLDGVEFSKIVNPLELFTALSSLCDGLIILQRDYNFVHRDFHSGNVMYDKDKTLKNVSIIDFGYSCFTIKQTPGSIQTVNGGYGYNQIAEYKSHIPCVNKSHDICTLVLSLLQLEYNRGIEWLLQLGQGICRMYLLTINTRPNKFESPSGFAFIHGQVQHEKNPFGVLRKTGKTWVCQSRYDNIFHPFYVYEMFDIDIGMTPENVKTYLDSASPYVNTTSFDVTELSNTIGNLKF